MLELTMMAIDGLITLIILFGANRVLWWAVGRKINVKLSIEKKKPETKTVHYE